MFHVRHKKRKNYNTTLDKNLLQDIKLIGAKFGKNQNELLEEAIRLIRNDINSSIASNNEVTIENKSTSDDRINKNTTIDRELIRDLRILKAKTNLNINVIIEAGLRKIQKKYTDKYTQGASSI
jgi:hypothetical protein